MHFFLTAFEIGLQEGLGGEGGVPNGSLPPPPKKTPDCREYSNDDLVSLQQIFFLFT